MSAVLPDMPASLVSAFLPLLISGVMSVLLRCVFGVRGFFLRNWVSAAVGFTAVDLLAASWPTAAGGACSLIAALIIRWWSRRRRKRTPKRIGAKGRAVLPALVRRMRDTAVPRPVSCPSTAPQGAAS